MKPPESRHPSRRIASRLLRMMTTSELRVVDRLVSIERTRDRRQRVFKPCRAVKQHDAIGPGNPTFGEALLIGGVRRRAFRTQQQAFLARHLVERSRNLL